MDTSCAAGRRRAAEEPRLGGYGHLPVRYVVRRARNSFASVCESRVS
jgi:hypothetical protein